MAGTTRLAMDVYKPATVPGTKVPALLFFNRATGAERSGRFYSAWARAAASNGLMSILPDLRGGNEAACLLNGDAEAAIAWLRSIPPQFRPPSVGEDPACAAIRNRADFRALFERR